MPYMICENHKAIIVLKKKKKRVRIGRQKNKMKAFVDNVRDLYLHSCVREFLDNFPFFSQNICVDNVRDLYLHSFIRKFWIIFHFFLKIFLPLSLK